MKLVLLSMLSVVILGCTNHTTVHLYGRYLSETNIRTIKETLEKQDLRVEVNQFDFPSDIQQSTILYSPLLKNTELVSEISKQLSLLDYQIHQSQTLVSGKHFYTKNNLGLFVLPDNNTHQKHKIDIAKEYLSTNCEQSVSLHLKQDGSYQLSFEKLPFPKETDYLEGVWRITQYPYILLGSKQGYEWFYFRIENRQDSDRLGPIDKTLLIGADKYSMLYACDFVYGLRP